MIFSVVVNPHLFLWNTCFALLKIPHISHRRSSRPLTPGCACRSGLSPHKLVICTLCYWEVHTNFLNSLSFSANSAALQTPAMVLCIMKEESSKFFFGLSCALVTSEKQLPCLGLLYMPGVVLHCCVRKWSNAVRSEQKFTTFYQECIFSYQLFWIFSLN